MLSLGSLPIEFCFRSDTRVYLALLNPRYPSKPIDTIITTGEGSAQ